MDKSCSLRWLHTWLLTVRKTWPLILFFRCLISLWMADNRFRLQVSFLCNLWQLEIKTGGNRLCDWILFFSYVCTLANIVFVIITCAWMCPELYKRQTNTELRTNIRHARHTHEEIAGKKYTKIEKHQEKNKGTYQSFFAHLLKMGVSCLNWVIPLSHDLWPFP